MPYEFVRNPINVWKVATSSLRPSRNAYDCCTPQWQRLITLPRQPILIKYRINFSGPSALSNSSSRYSTYSAAYPAEQASGSTLRQHEAQLSLVERQCQLPAGGLEAGVLGQFEVVDAGHHRRQVGVGTVTRLHWLPNHRQRRRQTAESWGQQGRRQWKESWGQQGRRQWKESWGQQGRRKWKESWGSHLYFRPKHGKRFKQHSTGLFKLYVQHSIHAVSWQYSSFRRGKVCTAMQTVMPLLFVTGLHRKDRTHQNHYMEPAADSRYTCNTNVGNGDWLSVSMKGQARHESIESTQNELQQQAVLVLISFVLPILKGRHTLIREHLKDEFTTYRKLFTFQKSLSNYV